MSTEDIITRAVDWCKEHGQFPTPANLETILRVWKATRQEDYWTCQDAIVKLTSRQSA